MAPGTAAGGRWPRQQAEIQKKETDALDHRGVGLYDSLRDFIIVRSVRFDVRKACCLLDASFDS